MTHPVWERLDEAEFTDIAEIIKIVTRRVRKISESEYINAECIIRKLTGRVLTQDDYIELLDAAELGVKNARPNNILLQWARLEQFLRRIPSNQIKHLRNDPRNVPNVVIRD
jgi:hypothetical protein